MSLVNDGPTRHSPGETNDTATQHPSAVVAVSNGGHTARSDQECSADGPQDANTTAIPSNGALLGPAVAVGDDITASDTRWSFAGSTPKAFDSHVNKSVPLYQEGHRLIHGFIDFFSRPGGTIIDVGCSTGTLLESLARKPVASKVSFIGYDIEADMVRQARVTCANLDNVTVRQGDAQSIDYADSTAVIMYYTLQFVSKGQRETVLRRAVSGLRAGGALLLFEKTLACDARTQDMVNQLYMDFKRANGFDNNEIYNKTLSLRSVMEPQPSEDTHALLRACGFSSVLTVQKYLAFEGILAIK